MNDHRHINPEIGTLSGEASEQRSGSPGPVSQSVVKKSPWSWDIPAYYFVGGTTGALMTISTAATLLNRTPLTGLIVRSRWLATAGASLSAILLIHDLGRPSRFLHMLRVFRPTSPMSIGTYILMSFSSFTGLSAISSQILPRFSDAAAFPAGILGLALSGYTGVLIANTAVPVWHKPHRLMPVLFLASGTTSAASVLDLIGGTAAEQRATDLFGKAGKLTEIVVGALIEREVGTVPEVARPLNEGFSGTLWQAGKWLNAASLVLSLLPRPSNRLRRVTGLLGAAGALCMRFGIHYAGQVSAQNSRATFRQQRGGEGAYAITGKAAITGPGGERAY